MCVNADMVCGSPAKEVIHLSLSTRACLGLGDVRQHGGSATKDVGGGTRDVIYDTRTGRMTAIRHHGQAASASVDNRE